MSDHVEARKPSPSLAERLLSAAAICGLRPLEARLARWRRRRTIAAFETLSDWMLHDIGLVRHRIPDVVDGQIADDVRLSSVAAPPRRARSRRC